MTIKFMTLLNAHIAMAIAMAICAAGAIVAAQGGLAIARATDRHLLYASVAIQNGPLIFCFFIPMMTLVAAGSATLPFCIAAVLLGSIAAADAQRCVIPDVLAFSFATVGIVAHPFDPQGFAITATFAFVCLFFTGDLALLILAKNGRPSMIGHGDIKMIAAIGANVSIVILPFVVLQACMLALAYWALMLRQRRARIPLGPFLSFACATVPAWPQL